MIRINPPHGHFRPDHLEHVIGEMRRRGAPILRASYDREADIWHAREGTHRLRVEIVMSYDYRPMTEDERLEMMAWGPYPGAPPVHDTFGAEWGDGVLLAAEAAAEGR